MDRPSHKAAADTIFALSSGLPPAAIAILRVSGPLAGLVAQKLAGTLPEPRKAALRTLRDEAGEMLDRAMLLWLPAKATATGEDMCEFHVHGGRAVIAAVSGAIEACGCRLAIPGEFTRRALFNGKMELSAVEGLADLLACETETQRRDALARANGVVARKFGNWRERLIDIAAHVEAAIDYDGDDDIATAVDDPLGALKQMIVEIEAALRIAPAERLRDGVRVAIVGPPNSGKSTLFNALVGRTAAIVSDIAGTTRDVIEQPVAIDGVPFVFVDTAGLRETDDPVERIGVVLAKNERLAADIVIDLAEASVGKNVVPVAAMVDIKPPRGGALAVSAVTGSGLSALQRRLCEVARLLLPTEGEVSFGRRHRAALQDIAADLIKARRLEDCLFAAEHIRLAIRRFDTILGRDGVEDMLDALFGRFCLGK